MPDPRHDPARLTEHARQLRSLADQGRAALNEDTLRRSTRLGEQRDEASRRAQAVEREWKAAEEQGKKELVAAEQADKAAAALERRASKQFNPELRESAAEQRALAESHRQRAHTADAQTEAVSTRWMEQRVVVEDLDKQLAGEPARRAKLDAEVDALEEHADMAKGIADIGDEVARMERRLAEAESHGDAVVVERLRRQITEARTTMDRFHDERAKMPAPSPEVMTELGVTIAAGAFDVPSVPMTPVPPGAPVPDDLAADERTTGDGNAVAAAEVPGATDQPGEPTAAATADEVTAEDRVAVVADVTADGSAAVADRGLEELVLPPAGATTAADERTADPVLASAPATTATATATAAALLRDPFASGTGDLGLDLPTLGDPGFTPPGGDTTGDPGFIPAGSDDGSGLGDPGFTPPDGGATGDLDLPAVRDPGFIPPGGDDGPDLDDPGFTPPGGADSPGPGDPGFTPGGELAGELGGVGLGVGLDDSTSSAVGFDSAGPGFGDGGAESFESPAEEDFSDLG